jgi:hypothetical protein
VSILCYNSYAMLMMLMVESLTMLMNDRRLSALQLLATRESLCFGGKDSLAVEPVPGPTLATPTLTKRARPVLQKRPASHSLCSFGAKFGGMQIEVESVEYMRS